MQKDELQSSRVSRELKGSSDVYAELLGKFQELQLLVNDSSAGSVRIVDRAFVPPAPVSPAPVKALSLSLVLGMGLGVAMAFTRRALSRKGAEDPELIEREVGIPAYGSIPHSFALAKHGSPGRQKHQ